MQFLEFPPRPMLLVTLAASLATLTGGLQSKEKSVEVSKLLKVTPERFAKLVYKRRFSTTRMKSQVEQMKEFYERASELRQNQRWKEIDEFVWKSPVDPSLAKYKIFVISQLCIQKRGDYHQENPACSYAIYSKLRIPALEFELRKAKDGNLKKKIALELGKLREEERIAQLEWEEWERRREHNRKFPRTQ